MWGAFLSRELFGTREQGPLPAGREAGKVEAIKELAGEVCGLAG